MDPQFLIILLATLAGLFLIARVLRWLLNRSRLPYRRVDSLLTPAERSFYAVLARVAEAEKVQVFAKVRLADLFWLPGDADNRLRHQNRINQKHVDFVLCDRRQLAPLVAIELDDSSHQRRDRQDRDAFVNEACAVAGLPLVRVPVQTRYDDRELAGSVRRAIERGRLATRSSSDRVSRLAGESRPPIVVEKALGVRLPLLSSGGASSTCPKCGDVLVERRSSRTGQQFMGCRSHPTCRHTQLLVRQTAPTERSR